MKTRKNYETLWHFQVDYFVRVLVSLMSSRGMKFADQMNNNLLVCERSSPQELFLRPPWFNEGGKSLVSYNAADPSDFLNNFSDKQQGFL